MTQKKRNTAAKHSALERLLATEKDYKRIIEEVRKFQRKRRILHYSTIGRWTSMKHEN